MGTGLALAEGAEAAADWRERAPDCSAPSQAQGEAL